MEHTKDILVAENERSTAESIRARLGMRGEFRVDVVPTGYGALRSISAVLPDALLVDTALPDLSGSEVCRVLRSREQTMHLPIIMLGDRSVNLDPVAGLDRGADDYLTKPFDTRELEARLHAVLRRHVHRRERPVRFHGTHLDADFAGISVDVDGAPVRLTRRELTLLQFLVEHENEVQNRERLLIHVWGSDAYDCRVVDAAIWKLRTKLRQAGSQIETVFGLGYRFIKPRHDQQHERSAS